MSDVTARGRDGYTPVDTAEYWAARAPSRSLECLATLAVILCIDGRRTAPAPASDPVAYSDTHRRLGDEADRVRWTDEP